MDSLTGEEGIQIKIDPKYGRINPSKRFLSEPMMHHILKHASPKTYFKLIQTTKYFLVNELPQIECWENMRYWEVIGKRAWIKTKSFEWIGGKNSVARYFERVYRCDITDLTLYYQTLTYEDLKFLMGSGTINCLSLWKNTFTHSNGSPVDIEDILVMVPLIRLICYHSGDSCFTFTSQKTAALPIFKNLSYLMFASIGESFNSSGFCEFLKKTKFSFVQLRYTNSSLSYQHDLQEALGSIPNMSFIERNRHLEIRKRRVVRRRF